MLDILESTKQQADPGVMVMINSGKTFDTLSWSFLHKTLDYFNFGPVFKQYVSCYIVYQNALLLIMVSLVNSSVYLVASDKDAQF